MEPEAAGDAGLERLSAFVICSAAACWLLPGQVSGSVEMLAEADDGAQRRAQIVDHRRQDFRSGVIGGLGVPPGGFHFGRTFLDTGFVDTIRRPYKVSRAGRSG